MEAGGQGRFNLWHPNGLLKNGQVDPLTTWNCECHLSTMHRLLDHVKPIKGDALINSAKISADVVMIQSLQSAQVFGQLPYLGKPCKSGTNQRFTGVA